MYNRIYIYGTHPRLVNNGKQIAVYYRTGTERTQRFVVTFQFIDAIDCLCCVMRTLTRSRTGRDITGRYKTCHGHCTDRCGGFRMTAARIGCHRTRERSVTWPTMATRQCFRTAVRSGKIIIFIILYYFIFRYLAFKSVKILNWNIVYSYKNYSYRTSERICNYVYAYT